MGQELVTRAQADVLFTAVLVLGLVLGPAAAAVARRRGADPLLAGLLWGAPPVLVGLMWRVYNAVTDRIGLDRVANLGINAVLFVALGAACGVTWSVLAARRAGRYEAGGDAGAGEPVLVGGPAGPAASGARAAEESAEPPRNP